MAKNARFILRNQQEEICEFTDKDIIAFLENLYSDWNEFIVLDAGDEPIDNVCFVQAFWNDDILHTEIGVMTDEKPKLTLYECDMTMEDGMKLFLDFFHGKWSGNLDEFCICEMQP